MAVNSYDKLELHKSDCGDTGHALDWCHSVRLRERLLTEIHALEQEMRLKERMVALGEMAAGMAHELRNPLAAISGW